jgi:hypothetical protein
MLQFLVSVFDCLSKCILIAKCAFAGQPRASQIGAFEQVSDMKVIHASVKTLILSVSHLRGFYALKGVIPYAPVLFVLGCC